MYYPVVGWGKNFEIRSAKTFRVQCLLLGHIKIVLKRTRRVLQKHRSFHKIGPNPELPAFLKKIQHSNF
ncbi:hypothetical protein LEP1GSC133_4851 [Leptospira borgpetersenii serovar Pomona str. 200901868]|uniref:Uncharacterized protein n=1 Tax=Leptospira borgpetersenii serovar Pomona str. 200901868 TaxID=1192866 RepID=M6WAH3_LEPBO|nr:hypothetical protein LEP1GSC133_4851 [Leptospira borgpetersenii serovar Pomona str. 200901868]